jgi:hypothetical protein
MDKFKARWNNAIRIAETINKLFDEGYLIYTDDGDEMTHKFVVTDEHIYLPFGDCRGSKETSRIVYFENTKDMDDGMHTSIKEYNALFESWKMIRPEHIVKLKLKRRN